MVTLHNLGFPRIGAQRELKFGLESYWKGQSTRDELKLLGQRLRHQHWQQQNQLDWLPVGDFSFYDQVLDMSLTLGHIPNRFRDFNGDALDQYFRIARGRSALDAEQQARCVEGVAAGEMTKWFDTNYHYIVPEFKADTSFELDASRLLTELEESKKLGIRGKPVIIGPVSYLYLGKSKDGSDKLQLLPRLIEVYAALLHELAKAGAQWVQIDEPILVTDINNPWRHALEQTYHNFKACPIKILLTTYFGALQENAWLAANLPVAGLHVDGIAGRDEILSLIGLMPEFKILSLGVINGRNIWATDLNATLNWLKPIAKRLGNRLWLAPNCSLIHVPVDLSLETNLDSEIQHWLAFATQKLNELHILGTALNYGSETAADALEKNRLAIVSRRESRRVTRHETQSAINTLCTTMGQRQSNYAQRNKVQQKQLNLPLFPTTTIGSFPQTPEIRKTRQLWKSGQLKHNAYTAAMQSEIKRCIDAQKKLDLDVLVHGEAERNDMVEYFGEQLEGYAFSQLGWVQSYGSRCVKPPILFGDIHRPKAMTVDWACYAQSLTNKPVKGMLTGPVTMLNWSFVRDDQARSLTCKQLALAIRAEVLDLEKAGIQIIQIDEPALREGLPLRQSQQSAYLQWAVEAFRLSANGVQDATQIHTHMCYSEFNDIMPAIAELDADVITIETSRSDMELLEAFDHFNYPNEIGPGIYDIHSPNIPAKCRMVELMIKAARRIPANRLWVNPDCGLKTRQWDEVIPALQAMVTAAQELRGLEYDAATV